MNKDKIAADLILEISLIVLSLVSICISPIYHTFLFSVPIIFLLLASYYATKFLLPKSDLYQYVASSHLAFFTALLIYQMHGMIEMHFWHLLVQYY